MPTGKKILVTGGSGRLGSLMCSYLKSKGYLVTNFDSVPAPAGTPTAEAEIPFVKGDVLNLGDCMRAISLAQPEVIVHLGAIPNNTELVPFYDKDYNLRMYSGVRMAQRLPEDTTMKVNVMGTYYIFDAARRMNVKNIIFASSYFTLGIGFRLSGTSFVPEFLPIDETHPNLPEDSYSLSKVLGEEIAKAFVRSYGMNCIAHRYLGVYFDHIEQSRQMARHGITVPEATPEELEVFTGNTFQYVDARDICDITELSIQKIGAPELRPFEEFFVATDSTYKENTTEVIAKRWPSLAEKGKNLRGTEGLITIKKAQELLGYNPVHSWRNKKA